jgi:hypothetical protein
MMKYILALLVTIILLMGISGCVDIDNNHTEEMTEMTDDGDENGGQDNSITNITVSSVAFEQNGEIPARYTCDGENINPQLMVGNLPNNTESLVLIIDDPDAPAKTFTHWIVWNIEPETVIHEHSVPGVQGLNDFQSVNYSGPCPPSGIHRYSFRIYALNTTLGIAPGSERDVLEAEMKEYVIAKGELMGTYSRR